MRTDDNVARLKNDSGALGNFGETTPRNSFSGGERDNLFLNDKGKQFYDIAGIAGLDDPGDGRTSVTFDFDRDGWTDFVVASATEPSIQLYRNRIGDRLHPNSPGAQVVALRFVGGNDQASPSKDWSTRDGVGAIVRVHVGDRVLLREVRRGEGRAGTDSATMLVGLGDAPSASLIEVRWPSGKTQEMKSIPAGSLLTFHENPAQDGGQPATVEPYLKNAPVSQVALSTPDAKTMALSIPATDDAPALNLYVAMYTTCVACKKSMPKVQLLRDTFGSEDVGIWGVPVKLEETPAELHEYADSHHPAYQVLADLPMPEREQMKDYIEGTWNDLVAPSTVVTDAGGRILATMQGVPTVSEIRRLLKR